MPLQQNSANIQGIVSLLAIDGGRGDCGACAMKIVSSRLVRWEPDIGLRMREHVRYNHLKIAIMSIGWVKRNPQDLRRSDSMDDASRFNVSRCLRITLSPDEKRRQGVQNPVARDRDAPYCTVCSWGPWIPDSSSSGATPT